jgi:hypothetical protein
MRRLSLAVLLSLLGTLALSAAVSSAAQRSAPSDQSIQLQPLGIQLEKARPLAPARIPLRRLSTRTTLKKLIRRVNELTVGYNQLVEAHNRLVSEIGTCVGKQPVSRYGGYWAGTPEFQTTALDFTEAGDPISVIMATWNC